MPTTRRTNTNPLTQTHCNASFLSRFARKCLRDAVFIVFHHDRKGKSQIGYFFFVKPKANQSLHLFLDATTPLAVV